MHVLFIHNKYIVSGGSDGLCFSSLRTGIGPGLLSCCSEGGRHSASMG